MPIGRISFDMSNSLYLKELAKRQADFAQKKSVAYKIVVPDDLKFWYWLEFGTAGRQDAEAPFKTEHSGTYPIDPVNAHALAWEEGGKTRFEFHVDAPGIRPRLIYRNVRVEILAHVRQALASAFDIGIAVSSVDLAVREDAMPFAVARMGESLAAAAPGVKEQNPRGREGPSRSASEAWTTEAQIVPVE